MSCSKSWVKTRPRKLSHSAIRHNIGLVSIKQSINNYYLWQNDVYENKVYCVSVCVLDYTIPTKKGLSPYRSVIRQGARSVQQT